MPLGKFKTSLEREQYKNRIVEMYVKRKRQGEIAAELGISQAAVSQWIRKITKEWRDSRFQNLDQLKFEELHRINAMEAEMYEMWELSKGKKKKTSLKEELGKLEIETPGVAGSRKNAIPMGYRIQDKETEQEGNMEYWHAIEWCVDRRCKLIGLDAERTHKVALTDPTGTKEFGQGAREMLISRLEQMVKNRDEAAKRIEAPPDAWKPKPLTENIEEKEAIDVDAIEIKKNDDPVQKAIARRFIEGTPSEH